MTLYEYDKEQYAKLLCGVDEAGRGPLAGPVVAAAVILPLEDEIEGLNDSKKLSERKREDLYDIIIEKAIAYGIGISSVEEIEKLNILQASLLAMRRAVEKLSVQPTLILVDGNQNPHFSVHSRMVVKGDGTSANIAAASILAKVTRDRLMEKLDETYPEYGFAAHKGYGTKQHNMAILEHGYCPEHRLSFLKKMKEKHPSLSRLHGNLGESIAKQYLEKLGYQILEQQYRSTWGEVDIIAKKDDVLSFVEVKLRDKNCFYEAKESVVPSKQDKIVKTALDYLQKEEIDAQVRFDIVAIQLLSNKQIHIEFYEDAFRAKEEYAVF